MRVSQLVVLGCVLIEARALAAEGDGGVTPPSSVGPPHSCYNYPESAAKNRVGGTSSVSIRIGTDGVPRNATVVRSSGNGDLDQAAVACVAGWRYKPAMQNGKPIEFSREVAIAWEPPPLRIDPIAIGPHVCADHPRVGHVGEPSGVTVVEFRVAVDGTIVAPAVEKSSGNAELDEAARTCVMAWKYQPATENGRPVEAAWKAQINWSAPGDSGQIEPTPYVPDVANLEPMIHRLGIDTHMHGDLSTILRFTTDNRSWRCRQVFIDVKGEHLTRHWMAQGWDDNREFLFARTNNGHYIAVHIRADGSLVSAVSMDDATGTGTDLDDAAAKAFLQAEVALWNKSVEPK